MGGGGNDRVEVDDQTWLIDIGHAIIEKKRAGGIDGLTPRERLIHCLWIADYSMRSAGDLATARDLDARFVADARAAATALDLPQAIAAFSLSEGELERRFFDLFGPVCAELRHR